LPEQQYRRENDENSQRTFRGGGSSRCCRRRIVRRFRSISRQFFRGDLERRDRSDDRLRCRRYKYHQPAELRQYRDEFHAAEHQGFECSILTNTLTTSGGTGKNSASASGSIIVTMLVDGVMAPVGCTTGCPIGVAYPPIVTYNQRTQTLNTTLGNICTVTLGVATCTSPQSIQLILSTTTANSFNFVVPGLPGGTHTITLRVAVSTNATASSISAGAEATAAVGVGSLTAQVVKTQTPFDAITLGAGGTPTQTFNF
jgi:hypothetical protein